MGLIGAIFGNPRAVQAVGQTVAGVAEVFTENRTKAMEKGHEVRMAAMTELGAEFAGSGHGWWDAFCNGLNRLPRPMLALSTIGLFAYAMADPPGFTERMLGLGHVPEPLWWLLGAIVSFYFGAREAHHFRDRRARGLSVAAMDARAPAGGGEETGTEEAAEPAGPPARRGSPDNPALAELLAGGS